MDYERVSSKKKGNAQVQKEFIKNYLADNQEAFYEVMEQIREQDPRTWARLYIDQEKIIVPRTTDVNHTIGVDRVMQDLMLLGKTAAVPHQQLALTANAQEDLDILTHYEEIKEPTELLPSSRFNEQEEGELN